MKKWICLLLVALLCLNVAALAETSAQTEAELSAESAQDPDAAPAEEPAQDDEESEEEPTGLAWAFEKFSELKWYTIAIVVVLLIMAVAFYKSSKSTKWNSRMTASAAMCIAIAFVLSTIRIVRMPQGGSITPASMLPLILFALAYGPGYGLIVGCAFGLLNLINDPYVIHFLQLLVDYPLAYGAVALCCLVRKARCHSSLRLALAILLGYFGRWILATLSGVVFFAEYAGEQNALIYSSIYNLSYLGPEAILTVIIVLIPGMNRLVGVLQGKRA